MNSDSKPPQKIPLFHGTHYEMGFQQGQYFKENIHTGIQVIKNQPEFTKMKPNYLPSFLFWKIAQKKATKWLKPYILQHAPHQEQRVKGIADGSELNEGWIYLLMSTELVFDTPDYEQPLESCTDIAVSKFRSVENITLVARNFDYHSFVLPFLKARHNQPTGDFYATIDVTASPLAGTFNGMNDQGLFIGTNECATVEPRKDGLPGSILIQEALEHCATTSEVITFLKSQPRGSTNAWIVVDAHDDIQVVEYTPTVVLTRKPETSPDKGWIVQTNHYHHPELQKIEAPLTAVFGKSAPKLRQGVPIGKSSLTRYSRAVELFRKLGNDPIAAADLTRILTDHETDPEGRYACLCRHDPFTISAASFLAKPEKRQFYFTIGNACNQEYQKFEFES